MSISVKKNFPHQGECPTIDEYKQAHPGSGYPIKLPLGLKKLRSQDDPKIIRAYADPGIADADRPSVDYLNMHEFTSSIAINMLTLNHGNPDEGSTDRQDDDAEQCTHLMPE